MVTSSPDQELRVADQAEARAEAVRSTIAEKIKEKQNSRSRLGFSFVARVPPSGPSTAVKSSADGIAVRLAAAAHLGVGAGDQDDRPQERLVVDEDPDESRRPARSACWSSSTSQRSGLGEHAWSARTRLIPRS